MKGAVLAEQTREAVVASVLSLCGVCRSVRCGVTGRRSARSVG